MPNKDYCTLLGNYCASWADSPRCYDLVWQASTASTIIRSPDIQQDGSPLFLVFDGSDRNASSGVDMAVFMRDMPFLFILNIEKSVLTAPPDEIIDELLAKAYGVK